MLAGTLTVSSEASSNEAAAAVVQRREMVFKSIKLVSIGAQPGSQATVFLFPGLWAMSVLNFKLSFSINLRSPAIPGSRIRIHTDSFHQVC